MFRFYPNSGPSNGLLARQIAEGRPDSILFLKQAGFFEHARCVRKGHQIFDEF